MAEHHGTDRSNDQQCGHDLEHEHVVGEQQTGDRLDVAAVVGRIEPGGLGPTDHTADREHHQPGEPDPEDNRRHPLASQGLHEGVRGVHPDQHEHEQEQHHDCPGVHDNLYETEERRILHHVEDGQTEQVHDQQQCPVHGAAGEHHGQCGENGHRREYPEGRGLTGGCPGELTRRLNHDFRTHRTSSESPPRTASGSGDPEPAEPEASNGPERFGSNR